MPATKKRNINKVIEDEIVSEAEQDSEEELGYGSDSSGGDKGRQAACGNFKEMGGVEVDDDSEDEDEFLGPTQVEEVNLVEDGVSGDDSDPLVDPLTPSLGHGLAAANTNGGASLTLLSRSDTRNPTPHHLQFHPHVVAAMITIGKQCPDVC